jgi:hypothetical protein
MWRDFDETYEVSTEGLVRNKKKGLILKTPPNQDEYHHCVLKGKSCKVHRLVAILFIPNPDNLTEVDHIDRNRANNHVENLRWATRSMNCLNTKVRKDNKLGIKNIHFRRGKFELNMKVHGKRVYGAYKTIEEAITARDNSIT